MRKLASADRNGDGKIAGRSELSAAFTALDSFDKNGSRESLKSARGESRGVRGAEAMGRAASPALPSASEPTGGSQNSGAAAVVRADRTLPTYEGGQGRIKVATENGKAAAVQFKADMDVDTDGGSSRESRSDRHYQSQTSMKLGGRFLDADKLPVVVLPPQLARATGAKLGDLVEVEKGGKKMYAIYGENGPSRKIGEATMFITKQFDRNSGPNRAAAGIYTYTVLPGSGAAAGIRNGGPAKSAADISAAGERAFAAARARGIID